MTVARLQKIQIFLLQKKTAEFLSGLQKLGCFELSSVRGEAAAPSGFALSARRYQQAVDFLDTLFPRPRGFIENFIQIKPVVNRSTAAALLKKPPRDILASLEKLRADWEQNNLRRQQLTAEIARQELYAVFGLERARAAARLCRTGALFGRLPRKNLTPEMQVIQANKQTAYVQLVFLREDESVLRDSLQGTGFQEITLPLQKQDYAREKQKLSQELLRLDKAAAKLKTKLAASNTAAYTRLAVWADYAANAAELSSQAGGLAATEKTSLLSGWVPVARKKQLLAYLESFATDLYWREVEPEPDEIPPVVLQNTVAAPLEAVTSLYGLPNNQEFDPSPLMAPFFVVFYGLCLSDAGYGLVLILFAAALLWRFRANLTAFGRKLLLLNIYCGFSTIAVGLLTGSFFGLNFQLLPPVVRNFFLSAKIIDPMSNPLPLLGLSVGLGVLQMLTGLTIRWLLDLRRHGWREAFLKSGCWVIFLSSIFGWAGAALLGWTLVARWLSYLAGAGALFMVLTQGRQQKNPLLRLGSGLLSLYNLSSYAGDILSYTRLFALGLVTAVLAMVINYLAGMTGGIPLVGVILTVLIFIIGHTFDFLINVLGSFVHSARLQYVEYFSKFFEGGGRFFKPFSWQTKYVSFERE